MDYDLTLKEEWISFLSSYKDDENFKKITKICIFSLETSCREGKAKSAFDHSIFRPLTPTKLRKLFTDVAETQRTSVFREENKSVIREDFSKMKILVVEDNKINKMVLLGVLKNLGNSPDWADDGQQALEEVRKVKYDLILMDIQMPGMNGYEVTKKIRSSKSGEFDPEVPIIAVTAHVRKEDKGDCFAAGMNDFISKPFILEDLEEKILIWGKKKEKK